MTPVSAEITLKFRKEGRFFSAVAGGHEREQQGERERVRVRVRVRERC